jgi:hypothetical protein
MQKVMMQLVVRIPRLVRLVREVWRNPANADAARAISLLADKLYRTDLRALIQSLLSQSTQRVQSLDPELAMHYPESIHFSTMGMMEALIRYSYCRIIIIGCCRQLMEGGLFNPVHGTSTLAEEELESAGMIAMSLQHADQHSNAIRVGPFVAMLPLQVAFGSWCRLERGVRGKTEDDERERAKSMMEWCRVSCNNILERWGGEQVSSDMLKIQVEVLEGGPLEKWKARRLFPL